MASDWATSLKEINGINLTNYFPQQRSYNSVVFVHKKYLEERDPTEERQEKTKRKKEKKNKLDKCQQVSCDKSTETSRDRTYKLGYNNDNSVLEQTIRFAKNIVPLVIPPSEDKSNVFYTIKTSKKHKNKDKKHQESSFEHHELTHEREEPKKFVETYRKVKKESFSIQESVSHSSNNTLDDLNINQSLCCTFSEVSEKKYHKKDKSQSKKLSQSQKIAISESFEAVATENAGDGQIKIHLMNEKEKHFLSDSIKEPVLNAIRDCLSELNKDNLNTDITSVQKLVKCNSQKLDNILDKLTCIEHTLETHAKKLDIQERKLDTQERKLICQESQLDAYEKKLDSQERQLDVHERKLDTQQRQLNAHAKKLDSREMDLHASEKKTEGQTEAKRLSQPKVQDYKPKAKASISTLEDLGEDLIEIKEEYSSEEELHQELLDRRSKSTVVVELEEEYREDKKMEILGGGEVPRSVKGSSSVGVKPERPNRIPARFCWTDASRKT